MTRLKSLTLAGLLLAFVVASPAFAWQPKDKEEPPLEPEDVKLEVKDGGTKLPMTCTYYPSRKGKEAIPIICLHGYEGNRADYDHFAKIMQAQGYAVIVPDLRGHGATTKVTLPDGSRQEIDLKKMTGKDFAFMIKDLDTVKSWLLERNNAGELNLESLVVVGADLTTCVALNWAMRDWNAPQLINYKNGQDVKAMILLTPENDFKGAMQIKAPVAHAAVGHQLATLIVVGKNERSKTADAKRIFDKLERQHQEQNGDKKPQERDTVYLPVDTNLQGTDLVKNHPFNTINVISKFLQFRVEARAEDFPWTSRQMP